MLILGIRLHRCMFAWGGCDPIFKFDRRETVMGPAQLSSRNLEENADYRGLPLKDRFGGLPVHDEHVPHRMHTPQRLRVELEQRISTHEETLGKAVRNAACKHSVAGALDVITSGIRRDRACSHNAALPDVWVGSDTIAIFAKSA